MKKKQEGGEVGRVLAKTGYIYLGGRDRMWAREKVLEWEETEAEVKTGNAMVNLQDHVHIINQHHNVLYIVYRKSTNAPGRFPKWDLYSSSQLESCNVLTHQHDLCFSSVLHLPKTASIISPGSCLSTSPRKNNVERQSQAGEGGT